MFVGMLTPRRSSSNFNLLMFSPKEGSGFAVKPCIIDTEAYINTQNPNKQATKSTENRFTVQWR